MWLAADAINKGLSSPFLAITVSINAVLSLFGLLVVVYSMAKMSGGQTLSQGFIRLCTDLNYVRCEIEDEEDAV